jgi:diguanylate cyclase (GGDEF)-like protein
MAKGEVLGLLHLRTKNSINKEEADNYIESIMEISVTISEYLSLSIANIRLRETLANQSIRDSLTGLYNRRYMEEAIQNEIMRAARKRTKITIVMMDIDHFKIFNDTYGHKAGDALLVQLANLLKSSLRGSDIVCRYGGEEFIVILPETTVENTYERAEQLREDIKRMKVSYQSKALPPVTISMGIASYPDCSSDVDELFNLADTALYRAKSEGRDRVIISQPEKI